MNSADKQLSMLHNEVLQLDENDFEKSYGKNHNKEILTYLDREFITQYHSGELQINVSAESYGKISSERISSWEMTFRYTKDPRQVVSIVYSKTSNGFLVFKNGPMYYRSHTNDLAYKYPRAWNENSVGEQSKFNKMVAQRANTMIKMLNNKDVIVEREQIDLVSLLG